jgi:hypothetical protein
MQPACAREIAQGNRLREAGRLEEAVAAYRRAVDMAPGEGDAHYNLAIALRQSGDLRSAALAFRAAARIDPADLDAVQNVVDTLGLAVERGTALFHAATAPACAAPAPVSIVVCSIEPARLSAMQASFRAGLDGREHEFIVVRDARGLCEGYQRGLAAARHEIVVFAHDDVELASPRPFDALQRALERHDVVGLAGSRVASGPAMAWSGQPHLFGSVAYPIAQRWKVTVYSLATGVLGGMQALDGLLFAAKRRVALDVGFDAATFDGFHFYDLDFVYRAHLAGNAVAVTTEILAIHASEGRFDDAWKQAAERFVRKFPALNGPQGQACYFGREFARREQLLRFHEEYNAMGATP